MRFKQMPLLVKVIQLFNNIKPNEPILTLITK